LISQSQILLCIEQPKSFGDVPHSPIGTDPKLVWSRSSFLGSNENDPVGSPGTVNCGGISIFQHLNTLNIFWVNINKGILVPEIVGSYGLGCYRHPIYYIKGNPPT